MQLPTILLTTLGIATTAATLATTTSNPSPPATRLPLPLAPAPVPIPIPTAPKPHLKPWNLTSMRSFSPSGRPGSSPFVTLNLTIVDLNDADRLPRSALKNATLEAECDTQWSWENFDYDKDPYNRVHNCSKVDVGWWTFELFKTNASVPNPARNFLVQFEHHVKRDEVYVGVGNLSVETNVRGACGGSGVCTWYLWEGAMPVYINQARV
ncbi:hypothetical protein B0T17DRAFT_620118 [Bombardia bombarda]|uniref:Uncharacterized protein n=1 Tax=Bombardia bombarda TaxID=252184 RepID=A0AA39WH61_9PEZI|nr:hypothetical protein B0T17DRAFT_620118 [Bombardia bombarda]